MTSFSPASSAAEPLALRVLHFVLLFGLGLILILFVALALLSSSANLLGRFVQLFLWRSGGGSWSWLASYHLDALWLTLIAITPLLPLLSVWPLRVRSWRLLLMLPAGALLIASWWVLHGAIDRLAEGKSPENLIRFVMVLLAFTLALWMALRLRKRSWWWVGGGYLAVAPVLTYLAVDDATLRHPTTLEEIAPAFPGAEKSYEVLMRYGKNHPLFREYGNGPQHVWRAVGKPAITFDPKNAEKWREWLVARRSEIEADWAELAPVRSWWADLNTFDRIGDLTPARSDAEIMAFGPVRSYSQHAIAIAGLQALDRNGDAAFETLLPLLEVSRKLEPSARTLVRFMIARVAQKMALEAAVFVLDHATVSAAARSRFALALSGGSGGEAAARRLMGIEYAFIFETLRGLRLGDFTSNADGAILKSPAFFARPAGRQVLNLLSPVLYNPNKTLNLYGDLTERWQDLAARRELKKIEPVTDAFFQNEARARFKNLLGSIVFLQAVPAYSRVLESYWTIEDARVALRERLEKM